MLFETLWTAAHQAPLFTGFSRQEYWSGLPCPSPVKVKVAQWCQILCDSMNYRVHGILQARILEWVAVPFSRRSSQPKGSNPSLPHCTHPNSLPPEPPEHPENIGVFPSPGDFSDPGIKLASVSLQADSLTAELPEKSYMSRRY